MEWNANREESVFLASSQCNCKSPVPLWGGVANREEAVFWVELVGVEQPFWRFRVFPAFGQKRNVPVVFELEPSVMCLLWLVTFQDDFRDESFDAMKLP